MNRISKNIKLLLILFLILPFFYCKNIKAAYIENNIGTYESQLNNFPSSYKSKIEALHRIYPNAIFVVQNKFFDWGTKTEVAVDWNRMLGSEYYEAGVSSLSYSNRTRSLIHNTYPEGYRSLDSWAYNYYTNEYTRFDNGSWHAAAKATVAYYMDPRNFLDEKNVFMFESNLYHNYQNISGVEKVLEGTFMSNKTCPKSTKKYSEIILEAANRNNISAYMLASRLRQEQGTKGTSDLISGTYSGYVGYYNYFNVKASGNGNTTIVTNGLKYAKEQGWDSPENSISGGAAFIKKEYVGINDSYNVKGQLTVYLQKWDPYGYNLGGHQYQQNVTAPLTELLTTYNAYKLQSSYKDYAFVFYIPIYSNMPSATSLPNGKNPNNYLKSLTVNGNLVSGFDGAKTSYTYNVSKGTTSVYIDYTKVASTSSVKGAGTVALNSDNNNVNVVVTAENGAQKTYTINIIRTSDGTVSPGEIVSKAGIKNDGTYLSGNILKTTGSDLKNKLQSANSGANITITNSSGKNKTTERIATGDKITIKSGSETKTYYAVIYGDVNADSNIKSGDYVLIKNHIMNIKKLSGAYLKAADVNKDGKVSSGDYVLIKNNIMGKYVISQ